MENTGSDFHLFVGIVLMVYTQVFGNYGYIFITYSILNVLDWLTGWYRARKYNEVSSKIGCIGIVKKIGYWIIILVAFLIPYVLETLGEEKMGFDVSFLSTIGWFTIASLIVSEVHSILENLVSCGYKVPEILLKGLAVTEDIINDREDENEKE